MNSKSMIKSLAISISLVTISLSSPPGLLAQQEDSLIVEIVEEIFTINEPAREFPGGDNALYRYIYHQMEYPIEAIDLGLEGRVFVEFRIKRSGEIDSIKVVKGVHPSLDREAERIMKTCPSWTPGRARGRYKVMRRIIPIDFKLPTRPIFPGGEKALKKYIRKMRRNRPIKKSEQGLVTVQFIIQRDGSIHSTSVAAIDPLNPQLKEAAEQIVKSFPRWTPASQGESPVKCKMVITLKL